jgi:biopolymer transport protein ExbD
MALLLPHPRERDPDASDETGIPLAPLVDIVFLLLIFFLVATTYLDEERDIGLVLPRVTTSAAQATGGQRLERVLLNVRADGSVLMGRTRVSRETLYSELVAARRANESIPVVIRGDASASHGDMAAVYAICQRAGVRNIAVVVEPSPQPRARDDREGPGPDAP